MAKGNTVGEVLLRLGLDSSGFNNEIKNVKQKTGGLSSTIGKLGKTIAVAFSVCAIVKFSKECVNLSNIQTRYETKLATVMKQRMNATNDSISSVKNLASELQKTGVVGDEVGLAGASQFATFTTSTEAIKTMLPAMENLAVAMDGVNVSADSMTNIANQVGKAFSTGSLSSLTRSGITITDAEEQRWKTLTSEEEKAAFLAQVITQNVGNMNSAMLQTPEGKWKSLSNRLGDIKEKIGFIVNSLLMKFYDLISWIVDKLDAAITKLGNLLGIDFSNSMDANASSISGLSEAASDTSDSFAEAVDNAKELQRSLLGFDKINKLEAPTSTEDTSSYQAPTSGNSISNNVNVSMAGAGASLGQSSMSQSIGDSGPLKKIKDTLDKLSKWKDEHPDTFESIKRGAKGAVGALTGFLILNKILKLLGKINPVTLTVGASLTLLGGLIALTWDDLKNLIDPKFWSDSFKAIGDVSKYCFDKVKESTSNWFDTTIRKPVDDFVNGLGEKILNLEESISRGFSSIGKAIMDTVSPIFDWFGDKIEWIKEKLGSVKGSSGGGSKFSLSNAKIPKFANGGYVKANSPQLAIIGDNPRYGEYTLNEGQLGNLMSSASNSGIQQLIPLMQELIAIAKSKNTTVELDGKTVSRTVWKETNAQTRATGKCPIRV